MREAVVIAQDGTIAHVHNDMNPNDHVRETLAAVQRLRAAGAVLLGKTAADDFAYRGNGTSSLTGQVRNPHDRDGLRTPGGSSAGSAEALRSVS